MFNQYQTAHMEYIQTLRPDQRCYCGWNELGHCFSGCDGVKTRADYMDECVEGRTVSCPICRALPGELCTNKVGFMTWGNHSERKPTEGPDDH